MPKTYIHRNTRPVYTCRECVNSIPHHGGLLCPIFEKVVRPNEKACIYRDVKKK